MKANPHISLACSEFELVSTFEPTCWKICDCNDTYLLAWVMLQFRFQVTSLCHEYITCAITSYIESMNMSTNEIHFIIACLSQKRVWNSGYIRYS